VGIPAGCQTTIRRRPEHYSVTVAEISAPGVTEQAVVAKTSPGEGAEGRAAVVRTGEKDLGVVRASRQPSSRALAGVARYREWGSGSWRGLRGRGRGHRGRRRQRLRLPSARVISPPAHVRHSDTGLARSRLLGTGVASPPDPARRRCRFVP
jgi:hypothetical protein